MSVMCERVDALIFVIVVINNFKGCGLAVLQAIDWNGVGLNGSGNIVVEVTKMNTFMGHWIISVSIWCTFEYVLAQSLTLS